MDGLRNFSMLLSNGCVFLLYVAIWRCSSISNEEASNIQTADVISKEFLGGWHYHRVSETLMPKGRTSRPGTL